MKRNILFFICIMVSVNSLRAHDYIQDIDSVYSHVNSCQYIKMVDSLVKASTINDKLIDYYQRFHGEKILVLTVSLNWSQYLDNNTISFKQDHKDYPFDIYLFDKNKIKGYVFMNDEGVYEITDTYPSFIRGYHRKVYRALRRIRKINPDHVLEWDYWGTYLYVKNGSMYVYSIDSNRSILLTEYLATNHHELCVYYDNINTIHSIGFRPCRSCSGW